MRDRCSRVFAGQKTGQQESFIGRNGRGIVTRFVNRLRVRAAAKALPYDVAIDVQVFSHLVRYGGAFDAIIHQLDSRGEKFERIHPALGGTHIEFIPGAFSQPVEVGWRAVSSCFR